MAFFEQQFAILIQVSIVDICLLASMMKNLNIIDHLVTDARSKTNLVIAGDFNASAIEWGCKITNNKGKTLLKVFASFNKGGRHSVIELTSVEANLVTEDAALVIAGLHPLDLLANEIKKPVTDLSS